MNQIKFAFDPGTDGNVNFDALKVGATLDICTPANVEAGYLGLFDGTLESLTNWRLAGAGSFGRQADCSIRSEGGLGLLWYTRQEFGTHTLTQPLQIRAGTAAFAPIGGSAGPTTLVAFNAPVSGANVPLEFKQSIGANDGLRTGQYSKTLTFTLSTTMP